MLLPMQDRGAPPPASLARRTIPETDAARRTPVVGFYYYLFLRDGLYVADTRSGLGATRQYNGILLLKNLVLAVVYHRKVGSACHKRNPTARRFFLYHCRRRPRLQTSTGVLPTTSDANANSVRTRNRCSEWTAKSVH
jgi:hypothetical protein